MHKDKKKHKTETVPIQLNLNKMRNLYGNMYRTSMTTLFNISFSCQPIKCPSKHAELNSLSPVLRSLLLIEHNHYSVSRSSLEKQLERESIENILFPLTFVHLCLFNLWVHTLSLISATFSSNVRHLPPVFLCVSNRL